MGTSGESAPGPVAEYVAPDPSLDYPQRQAGKSVAAEAFTYLGTNRKRVLVYE